MPPSRSPVKLTVHGFPSNPDYQRLLDDRVLERVRDVDARARREPLTNLQPSADPLIPIGMEIDTEGNVTKNGYGVLHLPWLAEQDGDWARRIEQEIAEVRRNIQQQHGAPLKYLIWAGMGGSAEDKVFYQAAGLLNKKLRVYILDSTDPAKLRAILDHIETIDKQPLKKALAQCLVVGMAMGMTSYEPVVNLEKLDALYAKLKIPSAHNFLCMTLPGSILDCFAVERGYRRVALQLDGGNTTAGRHSGPLTRGSLYPLALSGCDLEAWIKATALDEQHIHAAFQLAGFLEGNAREGRDKVTLFLPEPWTAGAVWTKQDFEESLGKSERVGIKVVIGEKIRLVNYFPRKDERQQRCFVVVNVAGLQNAEAAKVAVLRRAGYPLANLQLSGEPALPRYMQLIHYVVFALGYLRKMNFVTQPSVELYKKIANEIHQQAKGAGGLERTAVWREQMTSPHRVKWRGGLAVNFAHLVERGLLDEEEFDRQHRNAAAIYAAALEKLVEDGKAGYGELTFFGDMRYQPAGKRLRVALERAGEALFRSRLKIPVDVYEGPAMNHSYHEMIIGYGRCFSTILLSEKQESIRRIQYDADYHRAQWLATQKALAERGRAVVALTVRDLSDDSRQTIREFFSEVARRTKRRK
jgi:glucose-6-phosphate isomerase